LHGHIKIEHRHMHAAGWCKFSGDKGKWSSNLNQCKESLQVHAYPDHIKLPVIDKQKTPKSQRKYFACRND
jgi:hypothetical protein